MENKTMTEIASAFFSYLKDFSVIKGSTPKNLNSSSVIQKIFLKDMLSKCVDVEYFYKNSDDEDNVLKIHKPDFEECPPPPKKIAEWIIPEYKDYRSNLQIYYYKEMNFNDGLNAEYFIDDVTRVAAYDKWIELRKIWKSRQEQIEETQKYFSELYEICSELTQREEEYDFIVADGFIKSRSNSQIDYPILFKRLSVSFDPAYNTLTVSNTPSDTVLDDAILYSVDNIMPGKILLLKELKDITDIHPLDEERAGDILKQIAHLLTSFGHFISCDEEIKFASTDEIIIYQNPVFILRRKYNYSTQAIEKIINNIKENGDANILPPIRAILDGSFSEGTFPSQNYTPEQELASVGGEDEEILLSNLANHEQLNIARNIEHYNAVVVQGPPGTGKTHTIANLLGHFLAQGKNVLITSHSGKALSVLKDKISEEVRPLCVYYSNSNAKETETSLNKIIEEYDKIQPNELAKEIDRLKNKRNQIIQDLADTRSKIYNIKHNDAADIIIDGKAFSLADIAKYVGENEALLSDIIPGSITNPLPFPLEDKELNELYAQNDILCKYETDEPNIIKFDYNNNTYVIDCNNLINNQDLLNEIEALSRSRQPKAQWELKVAVDGKRGAAHISKWIGLTEKTDQAVLAFNEYSKYYYDKQIEINDAEPQKFIDILEKMSEIFEKKGEIGKFTLLVNKNVSLVYDSVKINNKSVSSKDDCHAVISYINLTNKREEFLRLWDKLLGDEIRLDPSEPERTAQQYTEPIKYYLQWFENAFSKILELLSLIDIPAVEFLALPPYADDNTIVIHLSRALTDIIPTIAQIVRALSIRKHYLDIISQYAPKWAHAVEQRKGLHADKLPPANIKDAWRWKCFDKVFMENTRCSIDDLQSKCENLCSQYRTKTALLAAKMTWCHVATRFNAKPSLVKNLRAWQFAVTHIGKGSGKKATFYRNEAQKYMKECQNAVPCWIMSIDKALETLDPCQNTFDVIIIDEASQSDITSLAVAYMGKKLIVVGDDKQVSPNPVGIDEDKVKQAHAKIANIVPTPHLYLTGVSLYDIAKVHFKSLMLTEHFRCVPDIIGFSNMLAYDYRIKPLRESSSSNLLPHVINCRVDGKRDEMRKINEKEAQMIVALICACIETDEYKNKSIGVISLLGSDGDQIKKIRKMIYKHIDPAEIANRQIYCGKASDFQGDERDVIFLSMVDSSDNHAPLRLITADGNNDEYKKRYNVATSRAKDQLWIINSLDPTTDIKDGDIRKDLLLYSNNPSSFNERIKIVTKNSESPFEEAVCKALIARKYSIEQQYEVGAYRIDIVVSSGDKRIAVECDGNRYHSTDEQILNDMKRQTILERIGWKFIRIQGKDYYYNPEKCVEKLCQQLSENGIFPTPEHFLESSSTSSPLFDKVKKSAYLWLDSNYPSHDTIE